MRFSKSLFSSHSPKRPFFVTTPIFYVNAAPHIGHVYTAVIADAVRRFEAITSDSNIFFTSGTDEHGHKIQLAAERSSSPIQEYCNNISADFKNCLKSFGVDFTDFVRTTEERHKKSVCHFWNELKKTDSVYKAKYSGWYSINDECFVPENQVTDIIEKGKLIKVSEESGHQVEWTEEENYMFRLSAYKEQLQEWLKDTKVVVPGKYRHQLMELVSDEVYLPDLSISRPSSRVHWAIRVPDDPTQSVYVWLDALLNYLTAVGYPDSRAMNALGRPWPADLHVIGKDILKFHGVYWPAFLMAAGMRPPRAILCHAHWTVEGRKMSKSLGNVVAPHSAPGGPDALRYFLLRHATMSSDADFSLKKMVSVVNSELANTLGNLLSRCTRAALNPDDAFPPLRSQELSDLRRRDVTANLMALVERLPEKCHDLYSRYKFYLVADAVMEALRAANVFFETLKPWELAKNRVDEDQQRRLAAVLHVTLETLRISGIILQPIVPKISNALLNKLSVAPERRRWQDCEDISWRRGEEIEGRKIDSKVVHLMMQIKDVEDSKVLYSTSNKKKRKTV